MSELSKDVLTEKTIQSSNTNPFSDVLRDTYGRRQASAAAAPVDSPDSSAERARIAAEHDRNDTLNQARQAALASATDIAKTTPNPADRQKLLNAFTHALTTTAPKEESAPKNDIEKVQQLAHRLEQKCVAKGLNPATVNQALTEAFTAGLNTGRA